MLTQTIAIGKNQQIFVVKETNVAQSATFAQRLAKPTARTENNYNLVLATDAGSINQELEVLEDKQVRAGRSKKTPIAGRYQPGKFSFPTYLKTCPINATGKLTAPEHDILLRCALGEGTTIDAPSTKTQIQYKLNNKKLDSCSIWIQKDHTLFIGVGSTIDTTKISASGADVATANWDGEFMCMLMAGTTDLAADVVASATNVTVSAGTGDLFTVGAVVEFVKADGTRVNNTAAGYQITAITADTITVDAELPALATGDTIRGFIPYSTGASAHIEDATSLPIHGKNGLMRMRERTYATGEGTTVGDINTSSIVVLSCDVTIKNNIKYSTDEKNGTFYAKDYFTSEARSVEGSVKLYFRQNEGKYFKAALNQKKYELAIPCGSATVANVASSTDIAISKLGVGYEGKGVVIHLPHIEFKSPTTSGSNEVTMDLNFSGLATPTGMDDEIDITMV